MSDAFDDLVRLFPLPNLVLFPSVVQPLHIFEPRYLQMTADALAGDRLITLALLQPGWEGDYHGRPPLFRIACLGKIVADQKLENGRYNLLLRGLQRVRIVEEVDQGKLYRIARVELLSEREPDDPALEEMFRRRLAEMVTRWFQGDPLEQFQRLLDNDLPPGTLCDIVAFALPLPVPFKQQLLEELDVARRMQALLRHLDEQAPLEAAVTGQRRFPPDFSRN